MAGPAPLAVISGFVRSTQRATRKNDNGGEETFAVRASVLTEPEGGFIDVQIWPNDLDIDKALALQGTEIYWLIGLSAWAGRNGGAGLQATYVKDVV